MPFAWMSGAMQTCVCNVGSAYLVHVGWFDESHVEMVRYIIIILFLIFILYLLYIHIISTYVYMYAMADILPTNQLRKRALKLFGQCFLTCS